MLTSRMSGSEQERKRGAERKETARGEERELF